MIGREERLLRTENVLDDGRWRRRAGREILRWIVDVRSLIIDRVAEDSAAQDVEITRTQKAVLSVDEFVEIISHVRRPLILSIVFSAGERTDGRWATRTEGCAARQRRIDRRYCRRDPSAVRSAVWMERRAETLLLSNRIGDDVGNVRRWLVMMFFVVGCVVDGREIRFQHGLVVIQNDELLFLGLQ